jgi:hypothetical protein
MILQWEGIHNDPYFIAFITNLMLLLCVYALNTLLLSLCIYALNTFITFIMCLCFKYFIAFTMCFNDLNTLLFLLRVYSFHYVFNTFTMCLCGWE